MNSDLASDLHQAQINRAAYATRHKDQLEQDSVGSFALMHNEGVFGVYEDVGKGYAAGCDQFGEGEFSLIRIGSFVADIPTVERVYA